MVVGSNCELVDKILGKFFYSVVTVSSTHNEDFKKLLSEYYNCVRGEGAMRCMLLNIVLPSSVVIASHIFPIEEADFSETLLNFSDIDDMKNGLMLFKPLEYSFNHFNISFIPSKDGTFCLKVFNKTFIDRYLVEDLTNKQWADLSHGRPRTDDTWMHSSTPVYAPNATFDIRTTYGSLEGRSFVFLNNSRPYKRCLTLQARLARERAVKWDLIDDKTYDFEEVWTDEEDMTSRMSRVRAFLKEKKVPRV
jgi:HNH endonuclease